MHRVICKSKKLFFALTTFLLSASLDATSHNVIFVHLGNNIPSCIFTAMKQARYLNQDCDIYLLTDKSAYNSFSFNQDFFSQENISLVAMDKLPIADEHITFREVNKIDATLSDGFWVYTLERFFYLFDFIKNKNLENIVHLESDSMLYIDLEELLPLEKMSDLQIAAPFQSTVACIPCFVFIKDQKSLLPLITHILFEMENYKGFNHHIGVGDMKTLASFYQKFGASHMTPLPTLMPEYSKYHQKRKSFFNQDNKTPLSFLSLHASSFPDCLFDAAGLGIFVNGNDRKYFPNNGATTIHYRSLFDPSVFFFFWGVDSQGRKVPYLSFKEKKSRIINMHFHSKMLDGYTSYGENQLEFPNKNHL